MSENMKSCCGRSELSDAHELGCVEQTSGERYVVEIRSPGLADVIDTLTGEPYSMWLPASVALDMAASLNRRYQAGMTDPTAGPLARPASLAALDPVARIQAMITEVQAMEDQALAELTKAITVINEAISLRERLEKARENATRPASATESAERASVVGQGTPELRDRVRARLRAAEGPTVVQDSNPGTFSRRFWANFNPLPPLDTPEPRQSRYRPGPY